MKIYHKARKYYLSAKIINFIINMKSEFPWDLWLERQKIFLSSARAELGSRFNVISKLNLMHKSISVTDFGGGIGWAFFEFKKYHNVENYQVLETKMAVSEFSPLNEQVDWISDVKSLRKTNVNCKVFYSNSAFQYLSPRQLSIILNHIKKEFYEFVVLEDVQLSDTFEFWAQQRYYNFNLLSRFFNEDFLIEKFKSLNYECILNVVATNKFANNWEYDVDSPKYSIAEPKSLVFKKI